MRKTTFLSLVAVAVLAACASQPVPIHEAFQEEAPPQSATRMHFPAGWQHGGSIRPGHQLWATDEQGVYARIDVHHNSDGRTPEQHLQIQSKEFARLGGSVGDIRMMYDGKFAMFKWCGGGHFEPNFCGIKAARVPSSDPESLIIMSADYPSGTTPDLTEMETLFRNADLD